MSDTPLITKITEYILQNKLGFHTPGHQQGKGISKLFKEIFGSRFLSGDLTEVPGLDNLHYPQGCLKESQALAARLFGAQRTFFLVNGSTVGIEAVILGLNKSGGKVLVARNAHISAVNGLIISGGKPVLIPAVIEPNWGIALGPDFDAAKAILSNNQDAELTILVHPCYQGVGQESKIFKEAFIDNRVPLLVDEAHGAHLFFQKEPALSAQKVKTDIVVQSTHKMLGALTQASMLHVNRPDLITAIEEALNILQTTSPSYLLLASLDAVQAQLKNEGERMLALAKEIACRLKDTIRKIGAYQLLEDELKKPWLQDPEKIVLSPSPLGMTGWELAEILADKYGIIVELSDYYYVVLLIYPSHTEQNIDRLIAALREISCLNKGYKLRELQLDLNIYRADHVFASTPRQAFLAAKEALPYQNSKGYKAAKALTIYPPGIPLIWPGQEISQEHVDYLHWAAANRLPIQGLTEDNRILVMKADD